MNKIEILNQLEIIKDTLEYEKNTHFFNDGKHVDAACDYILEKLGYIREFIEHLSGNRE